MDPRERLSDEDKALVEQDELLYGRAFIYLRHDGTAVRLDPAHVTYELPPNKLLEGKWALR